MSNRRSRIRSEIGNTAKLQQMLTSLAALLAESPKHISFEMGDFRANALNLSSVALSGSGTTGNVTFARGDGVAETAEFTIQDIRYEAVDAGAAGNDITVEYREPVSGAAATATLNLTADITLTSVASGAARNTNTFTLQVLAPAANPTDTILANFTGTSAAIVCTITPNDGTNNTATPVDLTTAELRELITTGAVVGKTVTITDGSSLRALQTATGGDTTNLADAGEGDGAVATFSGGITAHAAESVVVTGTDIVVYVDDGVTTADEIVAAVTGDMSAAALVTATATGEGDETQSSPEAATNLAEGSDAEGLETYDLADIVMIRRLRNRKWMIEINAAANPA